MWTKHKRLTSCVSNRPSWFIKRDRMGFDTALKQWWFWLRDRAKAILENTLKKKQIFLLTFQNEVEVRKLDIYDEHHVNGSFCATECQILNVPAKGLDFVMLQHFKKIFSWTGAVPEKQTRECILGFTLILTNKKSPSCFW